MKIIYLFLILVCAGCSVSPEDHAKAAAIEYMDKVQQPDKTYSEESMVIKPFPAERIAYYKPYFGNAVKGYIVLVDTHDASVPPEYQNAREALFVSSQGHVAMCHPSQHRREFMQEYGTTRE